jgi:dihydrofolate reductase
MAGKVFFSVTMSLDGCMAPEAVPVEDVFSPARRNDPGVRRWTAKWAELQAWLFPQRWIRENLRLGEGGEEGLDNDIVRATYERTGASVMGKRMFDLGEPSWPEEAPFHTPVFVLTHTERAPWERPGGTTFHFVDDGVESALRQAREAAGDRDVRIAGGADTIQQYLDGGLIDEFSITLAPVLLGTGIRLFDHLDPDHLTLDQSRSTASSRVTHLTYSVTRRRSAVPQGEVPVGQVGSSTAAGT